jgi:cyclomaltodextrinase
VSPWDVRFDPGDRAHLEPLPGGGVVVRVWAEPGLIDGAVVVRSPAGVFSYRMHPLETLRFTFWEVRIGPFDGVVEYSLAFRSEAGHPVYVVPTGVSNAVERLDRWTLDPDLRPVDTPSWARGAVIYQIFPERFHNGDPSNDPPDSMPWGSPPRSRQFQGGDLEGVCQKLDHLEGLGVDAVYLNPVFASPSNHKYDATDYLTIDQAFGGNDALRRLVDEAHARHIKVVLDASFNHVHPRFFAFADLIRRGRRSSYRDWFVVRDWPLRIRYRPHVKGSPWVRDWLPVWADQVGLPIETAGDEGPAVETTYDSWYGVPTMPRVDLSHPEARAYMLDVARHWVTEYDIDGWRMDVARYVDPDFWLDFRRVVKEAKPHSYLLSEIMGDTRFWLQGDRFDATMNYTFRDLCLRFFARDEIDGAELNDDAVRLLFQYPEAVTLVNQNLLGSHDTPRFLTEAGGELWRLRLATVFQLTFPGAPGIYYGDEVGMEGGDDPECRGAFPWEPDPGEHPMYRTIAGLTRLRRRHRALVDGDWTPVTGAGGLVAFERRSDRSRVLVAVNRDHRRRSFEVAPGWGRVLWGDGEIDGPHVTVKARSALILGR